MENLWFKTRSGMCKDWDDEFDAAETPPIVYEFPYSELAKQSNVTAATDNSVQSVTPLVPPPDNVFSKKSPKVPDDVQLKDGNILNSRKTYSKRKKNNFLLSSDVPQEHGKKQKEKDPLETPGTKHSSVGQQQKILAGKNLVKENYNPSESNDTAEEKTEANVKNSCKTELTNGASEYSLFGDIDQISSVGQSGSTPKDGKQHDLSLERPLNIGYQRTRKNLRKQIDSKMLDSAQSKEDEANSTKNSVLIPAQNPLHSTIASVVKGNRHKAKDSDFLPLGEVIRGGAFFNLGTPPPKKQLSLMDMVKKYSEIQNSQIQSKETSKKRKARTKKTPKVQKKAQTSKASSNKLNHNKSNSCNKYEEVSPSNLVKGMPHNSQDSNLEYSVKQYNHNATPCLQLPQKISNDSLNKNSNQSAVKSRKSVQKERTPAQKRQTKPQKPKRNQCFETKSYRKETDSKVNLLPKKHSQSSRPNSFTYSNHDELQSNRNSVFNSPACKSSFTEKVSVCQTTETKSFSTSINDSPHTQLPVASILNSTSTVPSIECVSLKDSHFSQQTPSKEMETECLLNHNSSLYDQTEELGFFELKSGLDSTFATLGSDFFSFISKKMDSLGKRCAVKCLEDADDWIAATPYSRILTVEDFCNNPNVMKSLLEFISHYPVLEKMPDSIKNPKLFYEFPEDFQNVPLFRMLKDYVDQVLLQMKSSTPIASLTGLSVTQFAYQNMPYRECCLITNFFGDTPGELQLADVAAKLNFVALLVIFEEFRERETKF